MIIPLASGTFRDADPQNPPHQTTGRLAPIDTLSASKIGLDKGERLRFFSFGCP